MPTKSMLTRLEVKTTSTARKRRRNERTSGQSHLPENDHPDNVIVPMVLTLTRLEVKTTQMAYGRGSGESQTAFLHDLHADDFRAVE
jgi:hypothetical protein